MASTLILLRHGESDWNRENRFTGWIDVDRTGSTVDIKDRSGGISVSRVTSDVLVDDGSGHIDVRDIGGNLTIVDDASGRVSFSGVRGVFKDES